MKQKFVDAHMKAAEVYAELSTLTFTEVQQKLADLYGGAAAENADTFQGKIDRLKVGFNNPAQTQ